MRIFAMNDCDWMAAETLEDAKVAYLRDYAGGLDEEESLDNPHELSGEEMDHLRFFDLEAEPRENCSFREQLERLITAGQEFPCFFASAEY